MFNRKKKLISSFLCVVVAASIWGGQANSLDVSAKQKKMTVTDIKASYVVEDAETGEIYASHKANKKIYPASTTKVLTICTIVRRMEKKNVQMNDYVKITKKMIDSVPSGSKCAYLKKKRKYSYKDLIGLVIVCSAADAVQALNKSLYKTSRLFVKDLNKMASDIGMTKSYFDNGIGLDKGNGFKKIHTTANDMMKLAKYASDNCPIINKMSKKKRIRVYDKSHKYLHSFRNTNMFYRGYKYSKKKYEIVGMKTGYTRIARNTLLTKTKAVGTGNRSLLVVVFNIGGNENVYEDTRLLLDAYSSAR